MIAGVRDLLMIPFAVKTASKTRIGILGGTFDPVHIGHLVLARDAMDHFGLSKVLFVPSATPPHKLQNGIRPARHRVAMLRAALRGIRGFEVCTIEVERRGVSYSIDTVMELKRRYPRADLYFIIGADTLNELYSWRRIDELLALCKFATMGRPGWETRGSLKLQGRWMKQLRNNIFRGHVMDVSSSDIRERVARGMDIGFFVPAPVERYIRRHGFYKARRKSDQRD